MRVEQKEGGEFQRSFAVFAAAGLLVFIFGAFARHALLSLSFPYPLEYGEGIVANWILRAGAGMSLYPAVSGAELPWLHNPYGPLYFESLGPFAVVFGNPFLLPRLVSLLSFASILAVLYHFSRRRLSPLGAIGAASLFGASPLVWRYAVMARVDMPALALSVVSLWLAEIATGWKSDNPEQHGGRNQHVPGREMILLCLSAIMAASAALVKPVFLAAGLAGILFCIKTSWRRAAIFAAGLLLPLLLFGYWVSSRGETGLLHHWTALNSIGFSFANFAELALSFAGSHPFCVGLFVLALLHPGRMSAVRLFPAFSAVLLLLSAKNGAAGNYFLPVLACAALYAGEFVRKMKSRRQIHVVTCCLAIQLAICLPVSPKPVFTATYGQEIPSGTIVLTPGENDLSTGRSLVEEIGSARGDVLCDEPGYLLVAGRRILVQPYQFGMLAKRGGFDMAPLRRMIEEGKFPIVVIRGEAGGPGSSYFPDDIVETVESCCKLRVKIGNYRVFENNSPEP